MVATLTTWTDQDGEYAVSIAPDPDTGDITISGEDIETAHTEMVIIPADAIPWLRRALGRIEQDGCHSTSNEWRRRMNDVTAALSCIPDDPDGPPHRRLITMAGTIASMIEAGEFEAVATAASNALTDLATTLVDVAGKITPGRGTRAADHPSVSAAIIGELRDANTDADLAYAWDETKALRLDLPAAEQVLVAMAWVDQFTRLSRDDGR